MLIQLSIMMLSIAPQGISVPQHRTGEDKHRCTWQIQSPALYCTGVTAETFTKIHEEIADSPKAINFNASNIQQLRPELFQSVFYDRIVNLSMSNCLVMSISVGTFRHLSKLTILLLNSNNLTNIYEGIFHGLHKLLYLDLSDNQITGFLDKSNFTGLSKLNNLDLRYNQIELVMSGAFDDLDELTDINLGHNKVHNYEGKPSINYNKVVNINISFNNLTVLPAAELICTGALNLQNNAICDLEVKKFLRYEHLMHLKVDHNNISLLRDHVFEGLSNLLTLNVSYNNIEHIQKGAFKNLINLRVLSITDNKLTEISIDIFQNLRHIEKLYINPFICNKSNTHMILNEKYANELDLIRNCAVAIKEMFENADNFYENVTILEIEDLRSSQTNVSSRFDAHDKNLKMEIHKVKIAVCVIISIKIIILIIFFLYKRLSKNRVRYANLNTSSSEAIAI